MSLQVWLPLTGHLNNQGLSNVTVTNNGATVDNNGKIGKCYSFNGSSQYCRIDSKVINTAQYSISFWMYATDVSSSHCIFSTRNTVSGAVNIYLLAAGIRFDTSNSGGLWQTGFKPTVNTWYHITCVQDATTQYLYVNGILNTTRAGTTALSQVSSICTIGCEHVNGASIGVYFPGKLNDFRIYDHALSAKEVKKLSKGLMLHYPLTGGGRTNENNLRNSNFLQGTNGMEGFVATSSTCTKQDDCMKVVSSSTAGGIYTSNYNNIVTGAMTTFSAWVKAAVSMTIYIGVDGSGTGNCQSYTVGTEWKRISISKEKTTNNPSLRIYGNGTFYIKLMKYELGDKVTPWMPASADAAYTAMGYNSTTEYDVSGYNYHGTKAGTITYKSDSARYSIASHFINGSYIMANKNSPDYLPKDAITVNLWIRCTTWGNPISCTESGGFNFENSSGNVGFIVYLSGVGYKTAYGIPVSNLTDGKWHMLTGVYDRINQIVNTYLDTQLMKTTATGSSAVIGYANNRLIISGEAQSTTPASSTFVGEESDVRIYATAFTADDVKQLYNTAAALCNNGTLFAYDFVEV